MKQTAITFRFAFLGWLTLTSAANGDKGPSELWKINADGTGLARFADTPGRTCGSPIWSPDGKFVAHGSWRVDQNLLDAHIWVRRADGTDPHDVGPGAVPSWSPDGKQIACHTYAIGNNDKTDHIVIMNADGSQRKNLLDHWGSPRWSPRGNRIFSILNSNIALYDLTAGTEHTILPQRYPMYFGFGVAADGKRICFSGEESGLYLATLDEKSMQASVRTLLTTGKSTYVSFAPDGKRIVFSYTFSSRWIQLYTMDVDKDTKPKRLDGQDKFRHNWCPSWSPDGKTIVFGSIKTD